MNSIKCQCGKTSKNFKYLSEADMPDGWVNDCCESKKASAPKKPEPATAPEPVVEASEAPEEQEAPAPEKEAEPEPQEEPKAEEPKAKRGRKPRK